MAEISTVKVNGGPYTANPLSNTTALIPPNIYVGTMHGITGVGMPVLIHSGGDEVLQDGTTGMQLLTELDSADIVAVTRPGVYLVSWTYTASAHDLDGPASGMLGLIGLVVHSMLNTRVYGGHTQDINAIGEAFGAGEAHGGSSAILWLGTDPASNDGFFFYAQSLRTDLVYTEISIAYSVTLLQDGGIPFIVEQGG